MESHPDAKTYHALKYRIFYASLVFDAALLIIFQFSGLSEFFRDAAVEVSLKPVILNGAYFAVFALAAYLVNFPIQYWSGFVLEHQFGLSHQTFSAWLKDDLKKSCLGFVIALVMVEGVYIFLSAYPRIWWMLAAGMWLFLSLVVARLTPTVIVPLFFKYSAVKDEGLRRRILAIFDQAKVFIRDAYVINLSAKTKKANAFICGLGRGRRVVLSDTLVEQFTPGEIETVVAHELGHYCHRDIARMIVVNTVVVIVSFAAVDQFLDAAVRLTGVNGISDIALFPMLILAMTVLGLFSSPLLNAYSRKMERRADRYSLELTGRPADFISLMTKLGQINLSEMAPSRFDEIMFYDHPPISQRIAMAAAFKPV